MAILDSKCVSSFWWKPFGRTTNFVNFVKNIQCHQNHKFTTSLPSATKLRRLCFYRRLSVHRGVGVSASVHAGIPHSPRSRQPPGADTPKGADTPRSDTPQSRHPPGSRHPPVADTPWGADPREQTTPWGADTHPPEQTPPREQTTPPRYSHCCGRYASYWNAFLFKNKTVLATPAVAGVNRILLTPLPPENPGTGLNFTVKIGTD